MRTVKLAAFAAALMVAGTALASAQNAAPAPTRATVYIPGLLPGPDRFGPLQRLCNLRAVGLVEWRVKLIENAIGPNDAQKAALSKLQAASSQARQLVVGACPRVRPDTTSVAELEVMGKRVDAVAEAFKLVRPAYEAFYATLDTRQKARIDALGPLRHGWRW